MGASWKLSGSEPRPLLVRGYENQAIQWPGRGAKNIPSSGRFQSRTRRSCRGSCPRRRIDRSCGSLSSGRSSDRRPRSGRQTTPQHAFTGCRLRGQDGKCEGQGQKQPAGPPGGLGEQRRRLPAAEQSVRRRTASHGCQAATLAGLKQNNRDEQQGIQNQEHKQQIKHRGTEIVSEGKSKPQNSVAPPHVKHRQRKPARNCRGPRSHLRRAIPGRRAVQAGSRRSRA